MKKNPVIPYAIIAVIGILLVIVISVVGVGQREAIQDKEHNGGEKQEQTDGGAEGGETAGDPEEIFQNNCASCHGADLSGGAGPALNKVGSKYSKDEIKDIIVNGTDGGMPGGLIQGAEAEAVAKWLSEKK